MATKEEILDAISNMTVLELSELLKDFEERFNVTAAAPVAVAAAAPAGGGGGGGEEAEEQDEFDVVLTMAGEKKIQVIKEVRARPTSVSRRPRTWSTAPPRPCSRRCRRKTPPRRRRSSKRPAPRSSSSKRRVARSVGP